MKKFNINDHMYIQIEEKGWQHLRDTVGEDYIKHCIENRAVIIDDGVWYRLQCHTVFSLFRINYGYQPMFKTTVMLDDDELS